MAGSKLESAFLFRSVIIYVVAIPLAFVWPEAACGCNIFVAVMWLLPTDESKSPRSNAESCGALRFRHATLPPGRRRQRTTTSWVNLSQVNTPFDVFEVGLSSVDVAEPLKLSPRRSHPDFRLQGSPETSTDSRHPADIPPPSIIPIARFSRNFNR
jgi:hypothetical protein